MRKCKRKHSIKSKKSLINEIKNDKKLDEDRKSKTDDWKNSKIMQDKLSLVLNKKHNETNKEP